MEARTLIGRVLLVVLLATLAGSAGIVSGQNKAPSDVSAVAFCDNVTEIPKAECQALVNLYHATNGASWTDNTGWLATTTPCSTPWYGVVYCESGHVTKLYLDSNNLSGNIPPSLGSLSGLWYLVLSENNLIGSIPYSLGSLSSLLYLDLGDNQLTGNIPSSLGNLSNLQRLYLHNNHLTGYIPYSLGNLSSLLKLYLRNNNLTGSIPSSLGNLSTLNELYVDHNPLSGALPPDLTNLDLTAFQFSNTNLCEPPDAAFQAWLASIPNLARTGVLCACDQYPVYFPIVMRQ